MALFQWLRRLSGRVTSQRWFRGRPDVVPLDLDRDWEDLGPLLEADDLPHARADVEGWLAQDGAVALVARKEGGFAGCMVGHAAGKVAHIDTVSIPREHQRASVTRPLYFRGVNALKVQGATGFVAHARPRPGRLLELLGYTPGFRFHLLEREASEAAAERTPDVVGAGDISLEAAVDLDEAVFGARREGWLGRLVAREDTELLGILREGALAAILVLEDDGEELVVRLAEAHDLPDLEALVRDAVVRHPKRAFRCWVRSDGALDSALRSLDFRECPDRAPFTEYRLGDTDGVGDGDGVVQLSWW